MFVFPFPWYTGRPEANFMILQLNETEIRELPETQKPAVDEFENVSFDDAARANDNKLALNFHVYLMEDRGIEPTQIRNQVYRDWHHV